MFIVRVYSFIRDDYELGARRQQSPLRIENPSSTHSGTTQEDHLTLLL